MKISKKSWHYRYNAYIQPSFERRMQRELITTCEYVRTTIFSTLCNIVQLWLFSVFIFAIGVLGVTALGVPVALLFGVSLPEVWIAIALCMWSIILSIGIAVAGAHISEYLRHKAHGRREERQSLLRQTLQDRKNGICTIITLED